MMVINGVAILDIIILHKIFLSLFLAKIQSSSEFWIKLVESITQKHSNTHKNSTLEVNVLN